MGFLHDRACRRVTPHVSEVREVNSEKPTLDLSNGNAGAAPSLPFAPSRVIPVPIPYPAVPAENDCSQCICPLLMPFLGCKSPRPIALQLIYPAAKPRPHHNNPDESCHYLCLSRRIEIHELVCEPFLGFERGQSLISRTGSRDDGA